MKRLALIVLLCLLNSVSVTADELSDTKEPTEQQYAEVAKEYRKAAEQGDAKAQHLLGYMYNMGRGVQRNYTEAAKWYRKAAEQGNAKAQYRLGLCYGSGLGVPESYSDAYVWLNIATASGYEPATKFRDDWGALLSPQELRIAQERSLKLFEEIQQRK